MPLPSSMPVADTPALLTAARRLVIPRARRHGLRLLVAPDTILRWHVTSPAAAGRQAVPPVTP